MSRQIEIPANRARSLNLLENNLRDAQSWIRLRPLQRERFLRQYRRHRSVPCYPLVYGRYAWRRGRDADYRAMVGHDDGRDYLGEPEIRYLKRRQFRPEDVPRSGVVRDVAAFLADKLAPAFRDMGPDT